MDYDSTISAKATKHLFPNAHQEMHFGNCSGYNELTGKKIYIPGTPHHPEFVYWLFAKVIGVERDSRDNFGLVPRRINRNGYSFMFPTFERDVMRDIQCFFIERQLIQSVGRVRLLRRPEAKAKVRSNFPLEYFWAGDPNVNIEEYRATPEDIEDPNCVCIEL